MDDPWMKDPTVTSFLRASSSFSEFKALLEVECLPVPTEDRFSFSSCFFKALSLWKHTADC